MEIANFRTLYFTGLGSPQDGMIRKTKKAKIRVSENKFIFHSFKYISILEKMLFQSNTNSMEQLCNTNIVYFEYLCSPKF